jgi:hypothetical protein
MTRITNTNYAPAGVKAMTSLESILKKLRLHSEIHVQPNTVGGIKRRNVPIETQPVKVHIVDVVSKLDRLAAAYPAELNWRSSIVDLLTILELDHSLEDLKDLALELGCPSSEMRAAARRNRWLHRTIMQKIAENGGNVPLVLPR